MTSNPILFETLFAILLLGCLFFIAYRQHIKTFLVNYIFKGTINSMDVKTPDLVELIELEKIARTRGSGIKLDSILGLWKFKSVWKKGSDQADSISSLLLRNFSASLELDKIEKEKDGLLLKVLNSISFGILSIKFAGYGSLNGLQPVLPFFFESIELSLSEKVLFKRFLVTPDEKLRPFFSLIAIGDKNEWLCARGRGGGLALWIRS